MGRMLIQIPRFYSKDEFKNISASIPEDYEEKSEEYWNYIEEKIRPLMKHVKKVYLETLVKDGKEGIKIAEKIFDTKGLKIFQILLENGAKLQVTEDPALIMEASSWQEIMEDKPDLNVVIEMLQENLKERDNYIAKTIDKTLKDDEMGLLVIESTHKLDFQADIKVIKMCRFDPSDYLNIFLQKQRLKESPSQ